MTTLTERIAARIPGLGVQLAYGEPTTVAGEEFVPVSLVGYGFGAGEREGKDGSATGKTADRTASGSGGGGGGVSIPVGAYVKRGGRLVFRANPIALLIFGLPVVTAVAAGIAALARATR